MKYRRSEAKDAARAQFRGVWAAITTPFTPEGELDEAGLRRNMRYYTDELAIDGVFCTGTMGEYWALTKEERKRVVEIVVEEAKGKCLTIPHTGHQSADETIDLTRHAQEVGADFAIVINPNSRPGSNRSTRRSIITTRRPTRSTSSGGTRRRKIAKSSASAQPRWRLAAWRACFSRSRRCWR